MPKLLAGRPPRDETEQRQVRKVVTSRHAPADWVWQATMVARSWEGAAGRAQLGGRAWARAAGSRPNRA